MKRSFGRKIGPTGRKRDEFTVFAQGHKARGEQRRSLIKAHKGNEGLEAYGQEGVKEAKREVHGEYPHKWVRFGIYNQSRLHRRVGKRRHS